MRVSGFAWAFAGAVFFIGCGKEAAPVAAPEAARPVKLLTLSAETQGDSLRFPSLIRARDAVQMAFDVPGRLVDLPVVEGAPVAAGTVLARLDDGEYAVRLEAARAALQLAEVDLERTAQLVAAAALSQAQLDTKRAALAVAQADFDSAQRSLDETRLIAPFDGVVSRRLTQNFTTVQAKQPIVQFQALGSLEAVIDVPQGLVLDGRRGDQPVPAVLLFASHPDLPLPVRLQSASLEADPQTQTYEIAFAIEDKRGLTVLPGMTATLEIQRPGSVVGQVFRLPPLAVQSELGETRVWVYDPTSGEVASRAVTLGSMHADGIEVLSGLQPGEQVVVAGVQHLREGMAVLPFVP